MNKKILSLVIPSYNEESIILDNLNVVLDYVKNNIDSSIYDVKIVVVDDGSKDNTSSIVKDNFDDVKLVSYLPNHGKGYAVRQGVSYSLNTLNSDYIIFMDADLSTDLKAIKETLDLLEEGNPFVVASRYDKTSQLLVKQTFLRRIISKLARIIISNMFKFKLKDTQCGFKGFNKDVARIFVDKSKMDGFSFDVEYLYIAKLNNYKFVSLPVIWKDHRDSRVSPIRSSFRFYKDLFKIKKNTKFYK